MPYLYLLTIPAIVGGMAVFLKLKKPWARAAGLVLMGVCVFALLLLPALWLQPG